MSIEAAITVTVAEVEVTDEFQVGLAVHKKQIALQWDEALQLADELVRAVEDAKSMLVADQASRHLRAHEFDVDGPTFELTADERERFEAETAQRKSLRRSTDGAL